MTYTLKSRKFYTYASARKFMDFLRGKHPHLHPEIIDTGTRIYVEWESRSRDRR